jgi:hypothetical protein
MFTDPKYGSSEANDDDDSLIDALIESNAEFRALLAKSKAGPSMSFRSRHIQPKEQSSRPASDSSRDV